MKRFTLTTLLLALLAAAPAFGAVIYVDLDATGTNSGTSWTNAYSDLQNALAASVDGDEIWIAQGVYKPTTTTNTYISFEIDGKAVDLYGGFNGTETARTQRDWNAYPTVLSGAIGSQTDITDNTRKLLNITGVTGALNISGIKFQRTYSAAPDWSVAYDIEDCTDVRFTACEFRVNSLLAETVAMLYCNNSTVEFRSCLFRDNTVSRVVGSFLDAEVTVVNCTFSDNDCNRVVVDWSGTLNLYNSILYGNTISVELFSATEADYVITGTTEYSAGVEGNVMVANPLYVDDSSNNFRVQAGSPAVGFGSDAYIDQGRDLQAGLRIYGDQPDAGCYEVRTASRFYVDEDATGLDNGGTWTHAFTDLQDALAQAIDGDEFWVAEGTYTPGSVRSDSFVLDKNLTLYGGFVGGESSTADRAWTEQLTVLSGAIGGSGNGDNCYHVIDVPDGDQTAVVDGFVIRDGYADDGVESFGEIGGGIRAVTGASLTVRNSWITENTAASLGGGIYANGGQLEVTGTVISNNTGTNGAACFLAGGDQRFESTFFLNNTATSSSVFSRSGAGNTSPLEVSHCTFTENTPASSGDVVDITFAETPVTFVGNIIWNNNTVSGTALSAPVDAADVIDTNIIEGGFAAGDNILDQDPQFVDAAGLDYTLAVTSPGFNAGINAYITQPTDALAQDRIELGTVDLGALESTGGISGVRYVDHQATGAADGSSWHDAFNTLEDALAVVNTGEQVWVAEGTYTHAGMTGGRTDTFLCPEGVALRGGFSGIETAADQAEPWNHETVLSGDGGVPGDISDNATAVLRINLNAQGCVIDGFTVTEGNNDEFFANAAVLLINLTGAAIGNETVVVRRCVFHDNEGSSSGASALRILDAGDLFVARVENCLFHHNSDDNTILSLESVTARVVNCTFADNTLSESFGNCVTADSFATAKVYNNVFWDNGTAEGIGLTGGSHVTDANITPEFSGGVLQNPENDPLFVNPAALDYRLQNGSSAIGYGLNGESNEDTDLEGAMRIQATNIDAGCYESAFARAGCMDATACNYDPLADADDGSCDYSCLACEGDFNNDGLRDTQDLLILLGVFGTSCMSGDDCVGDLTGDLMINTEDLLGLLGVFGTPCE